MPTWEEQEAAADRREAIENEAGERAAKHFATPEALVTAIDEVCLEDEELLLEAKAMCAMWNAKQSSSTASIIGWNSEALAALHQFTERVFARLCAEEKRKLERGE